MSRNRGPRLKIIRRFQQHLPGLSRKTAERRPYPPGQHGANRRVKRSDYRVRLEEKQKLRFNYGISERQLRNYFRKAVAHQGDTGLCLLQLMESRLDNVVFRSGFASTIPAARQLVGHGHVLVNGKRLDIPSYHVREGDVVSLKEKTKTNPLVEESVASPSLETPSYLSVGDDRFQVTFGQTPAREDVPVEIQEHLIIEFYSQIV
ncbi:MAG: 30S ribosomal protein S4 [Myxococcota bacterium]|nr:30S ribosomal protein S4 [Myxococcota bacterium]